MGSVFAFGPRGILPQQTDTDPAQRRATIDRIATQTQVPANILLALEESGEAAEAASRRLSVAMAAGKRVEEIIPPETLNRAYDIADQLYPAPKTAAAPESAKQEPGLIGDMARQGGGALLRGVGSIGEGIATGIDILQDRGDENLQPTTSQLGDLVRAPAEMATRGGENLAAGVSELGKQAIADSTPDGDILDPSTWTFGKSPSLKGYALLAADVLGSFLPVVATAVVTKSPAATAAVGGAQGGGAGAETARQVIEEMASTQHPEGGSVLQRESAYYRELVKSGIAPDEAKRRTALAAQRMAYLFTAPVSAFGGAATGQIIGRGVGALAGRGLAARMAGTAALSGLEEGVQEAAETAATRSGINQAAGTDLDLTEGTFGDFVLGALGGGIPGGVAGAFQKKTGGDGSAPGSAAVSDEGVSPPVGAGSGAAAPNTMAPTGPISTIAGLAPDLTPVPEPQPPAPKFPDFKPGKDVRLVDPETGVIHDAVFLSETPGGVMVRIAGGEIEIDRATFDQSRLGAMQADEKAAGKKPKAKNGKVAEAPQIGTPQPAGTDTAAADALKEMGYYDGPWNDPDTPKPGALDAPKLSEAAKPAPAPKRPKESLDDLTPAEAAKRAKILEDRAAEGGWTRPMREKHQKLKAIAGGTDVAQKEAAAKPGEAQPDGSNRLAGGAEGAGRVGGGRDADLVAPADRAASGKTEPGLSVGRVRDDGAADAGGALNKSTDLSEGLGKMGRAMGDGYVDMLYGAFTKGRTKDASGTESPALRMAKRIQDVGGTVTRENMREIAEEADRIMALPPEKRIEAANLFVRKLVPMQAAPIATTPDKRVQPDMLGGRDTTEAAMADRERRRKEWGRFLGIAEGGKSTDDSILEGREVFIRGTTIRIRAQNGKASDQDIRIDTAGMDRDQIAAAVRGAMNELDRRAPLPTSSRAEVRDAGAPAAAVADSAAAGEGKQVSEADGRGRSDAGPAVATSQPGEAAASSAPAGILSVLSDDKQARAAELKAKLAAKMRNQVSSGLDPEYITLGGELVKLYLEAGAKRFGQMLKDFAETTGLTLKQAQEPLRAAYNHVRDNMELEGEDVSGMDDARAVLEEARKAIEAEKVPAKAQKAKEEPKPRAPTRPTGKTYRLENALTPAERRLMASARDGGHYVGEVFAELDNAARRANADLASRDLDIDSFDEEGKRNGKSDQMAWFIREAEAHAKELIAQVKDEGPENIEPLAKDEDTGDWEYDGTPLSNALEFLDQQYAMGLGVDEDVTPGPEPYGMGDATTMDPDKVFPAPAKGGTRNIDALAERDGFITMDEAAARLAFWKKTAARIGSTTKNQDKVILSLFDYKGTWSQPWRDAGYTVLQHDIKTGSDLITDAWIYERIEEVRKEGKEVYGVLSACPCTTFTGSGARWWAERHDVESPDALRQVFGDRALSSGAKSALEYNVMLADATREAVRLANPTGFHVLENPIGRIQDKAKFPDPLARFHPHNFGDPYTKRTQLFGDFKADLPLANVDPVEGSKMQNKLRGSDPLGKEDRSTTPEGFAYAFFMANDPDARKVKDEPVKGGVEISPPPAPTAAEAETAPTGASGPVIEDIREKASVLRGLPKDQAPEIPGVSLKWDDRDGGFVFSRKHKDTVQAAIKAATATVPSAPEVKAAAAETDPNPTPAQAEAENYKTGKVNWRGLTLSIENAKGSIRRKVTPDGKTAWEVKMPAHYGRILGTTGADGDHVDFYMGPDPTSEMIWVIDQRDMETGEFDEHKVMIGFKDAKAAKEAYFAGFSDGNGPLRLMSMTPMGHVDLIVNLQKNPEIWKGPISATNAGLPEAPAKAPVVKSTSPAANRAFPDFKGKLNGPYYDDRSDDGRFNAEKNAFHDAGLTFFRAAARILKDNGWYLATSKSGKKTTDIKDVRSNKAGPAVLGDVSLVLMGPDGANGIYAQLGESFNGGNRAQMMWRINQATNPYGSGQNQFLDPTGMTPQEFAEKVIEAHGRYARQHPTQEKKAEAPADGSAFEAVGMVKGKSASEDAWFRKQAEQGGIAHYKARAVDGGWKLTRDFTPDSTTAPPTRQLGTFDTAAEAIAQLRENGMRTGVPEEAAPKADQDTSTVSEADRIARRSQRSPWALPENATKTTLTEDEAFELGKKAFKEGYARLNPTQITTKFPAMASAWYRGWDRANLDEPMPDTEQAPPEPVERLIEGTVEIDAAESDETVEVTVSREGPWDFNDTFPSPDPVQVGRLEVEGRSPFDANTPEEVIGILDETMNEAEEHASTMLLWQKEAEIIEAGGTPRFPVPKGKDPLEEAVKNQLRAQGSFEDTVAAVRDVWGDKGADAFRDVARARAEQRFRTNPPPKTKAPPVPAPSAGLIVPDSQDTEKPATMAPAATGKPRNEQRRNQRRDQGQPDLFAGSGGAVDGAGRSQAQRDSDGRGEGDQDAPGSQPGSEPGGSLVGDQSGLPDRQGVAPPNFTIAADFALGAGTDGQKLEANLAALRLVKTLEAENRYATPEEQAVLARWVGWGGLKTVFDEKHKGSTNQWGRAQAELKSLLTKTEYFDAMRSTNDAHYTSRTVVEAMWGAMRNFGFRGGRALEPTIGSGNFLGLQPRDLSESTDWFASELDPVTGRIAKHLYPRAKVFDGMGFQDAPFRPATFDIAIGNPPFGGENSRVGNKQLHPDLGRMKVHNFVIAKTGQLLREGGIMGMVVTHRFLDAMDAEARDVLAPNFHFLGAVRLPNTAFKANAGTEVTTDIVFFQKRRAGDEQGDTSWMSTGAAGPNGTKLNAWFANNPDMILGRPAMDGTMYAGGRRGEGEFTVHDDGRDLGAALTEALAKIKASLPDRVQQLEDAVTAPNTVSSLGYGEMVLTADGKIFRGDAGPNGPVIEEITRETFWKANAAAQFDLVQALRPFAETNLRDATIEQTQRVRDAAVAAGLLDMAGDPVTMSTKFEQALADAIPALLFGNPTQAHRDAFAEYAKKVEGKRLGTDGFDRLKAILDLRGRTKALIRAERTDDPAMEQIRGGLRTAYTEFRSKYGFLNSAKNEAILQGDVGAEMALEIHYKPAKDGREESATEAPILTKRVIYPHKMPTRVDSVADAIHVSMQEKGYIDPGLVSQLTSKSLEDVIAELTGGEKPLAFKNPATNRFEMAESYLSGNLAEKIEKATAARAYEHIPHLKAAMPPPKTQQQITPSIRSMWIPRQVFEDFLRAMGYSSPAVMIAEKVGMVSVQTGARTANDFGDQFRGGGMSPEAIFEHALKGKIPVVYDEIRTSEGTKRVKNEEATKEAVAAYERISAEFPNWAYANPMRAQVIIDAFNEKVNVVTPRKYEGTRYLRTVGTSPLVELRNSQKNGAWRMIQDKTVLLHHVVGAGKTMTGITGVMERKRMGLTRKAVVVVPNHLTGQWGKEWLELYPAANILVPTERDFEPANRAKLINRIATGDFDAVIIGHSQLVKIDNDPEIVAAYIGEQMDALNDAMQEAKKSGDSRRTVGQMANRIAKLREKLERLNDEIEKRRGSGLLAWHELGVDMLVLDESQEFKNLEYATTATQLVGMNDPNGSQKAFDLLMKLRSLQAMPNSNMTFMTGTPISNSLVEIYSVMKYLIPESLRAMGIEHFDAWKAAFIQDQSRFEYTASMQLKERNVMSGMVNLGPLAELYRSFADIVMRPDVERMYREQMEARNAANPDKAPVSTRFPTPKIKGGKRRIMLAPPTENMEEFTRYLVMRMGGIQNASDKKAYAKTDNPLWVLTDARKASVDIRTIDPTLGREEGSKVARAGAEIYRIWEANRDRRGAQMVFCDMSTPSKTATKAAAATLKEAYGKLGLKKDALKRRMAADEGKSFAARWSDVLGEIESLTSSPDTPEAQRDALNQWMMTPDVQDAPAAMFTADTGFSFYDDLRALLIEKGIPEKEIAFIHDYDTTAKKKDLFEAVNEGKVRVLLGSTMKMGAGTNAQKRLVALHHIDAPWRPSDMEQREGRIIRQGNLFYEQDPDGFEVEIIAYSTEKTADVVQWQVLERKAKAIETFLGAAADSLVEEGGDADQYAEFMAQSTGKKVFLEKMQAEKDLLNARGRIASALRSKSEAESFLASFDEKASEFRARYEALDKVMIEAFPDGAADYLADWRGKIEAYRAARDKAEAEAEEVRKFNVGKERKDWKKLPEQPNAPKRWTERPTNAYEAAVYDALMRAQGDAGSEVTKKIQLGNGFHIGVWSESPQTGVWVYYAELQGPDGRLAMLTDWGGIQVKDFRNSDKLLAAFDPAGIVALTQEMSGTQRRHLQRHVDMKPRMQEIAAKIVDTAEVRDLENRVAALTAETRIEEVRYAEESAKAGENRFAMLDTKGRNLVVDAAKPLTGQFQFQNAGRQYASTWGAPAGRIRIEGTDQWGDKAYFEANDMDTDAAVIVEAVKPPKEKDGPEKAWTAVRVFARTSDGVKEMRDFAPEPPDQDKPVDDFALRAMTKELNAEAEKHGLAGKITVRAVRQIMLQSGVRLESMGVFDRTTGEIQIRSDAGRVGVKGVMRHEIIHALRSSRTWGKTHGLFTAKEWNVLERAALADREIRDSVLDRYPDLSAEAQLEEMVAELYRLWADGNDTAAPVEKVLEKIMGFFEALANMLRGRGFLSAAGIMQEIANGTIGGAAPTPPSGGGRPRQGPAVAEMRGGDVLPSGARRKFKDLLGSAHWKDSGQFASNALTDAMAGKNGYNTLALVPGRALFAELGKRLLSAKTYLRHKEEMDSLRNDWHARADEVAQEWRTARRADPRANNNLMDLMHRSTLSGVDPSKPDTWKHGLQAGAEREISRLGDRAPKWAQDVIRQIENHKRSYATLKERYDALPPEFKAIYRKVRASYDKLGDEFEKAVLENIEAGLRVAIKRAQKAFRKEMDRIRDDGLVGEEKAEAIEKAQAALDAVKKRGGWGAKAKIAALRKQFESNRLKGPYFPLARFGQFFVTIRNAQGEVTSFSRFEREAQQQVFIREQKEAGATNIQFGVLSDSAKLREQVDPGFVADVEMMLADAGASTAVMDAIWQRWLETLPDQSIRTSKIHRKGREGWNKDAFRAFGAHMFHGAHQLARLKYGLELEEALNDAEDEARVAEDPNRAGLVVNEMRRRHEFTMNPQGSSIVAGMSSLAFVWYLGATPAAALANLSQTTVMGPGIMAARFKTAGVAGAVKELGRAMKEFTAGRGDVQKAPGITQDEHAAITEAYRRGTIDRTQAHDLASVAETGIEYNATREMVMRKIAWFFHQAERMNREVTFLANYRLARAEGQSTADAIDTAADLTWKIHFDYQNTSRPRFMQNDLGKVLTIFRNYTVNLAYRIFRDAHQSLRGATKEERAEARMQLIGVTMSMMLHAGIKGTYGYGIIMLLLSLFFPGDSDDLEEWMQDALLMEGDSLGVATWNYMMGAALNGVPGQILGADLTERIGSPNIWFRGPSSDLEGVDLYNHYVGELLGPVYGIGSGLFRGGQMIVDGEVYRGVEAAVPKVVRDLMKAGRYGVEGVETISGDDILENVNPYQLLLQASGFTPAEVSERFDMNTRLKNKEREILDERRGIHKAAVDAILAGETIPESVLEDIRDFNRRFPEYPITAKTIRQSAQGRQRARENAEFGVSLNPKISARLREELAPAVYN